MMTLVTGVLIGIVIASYMTLVSHQNATVARSQCWNASLTAAEAGVEEALAHLNPGVLSMSINRGANGWTFDGTYYNVPADRALNGGSYSVKFTNTKFPTIYAKGYSSNSALGALLMRQVEVKTTNTPLFSVALGARKQTVEVELGDGSKSECDSYAGIVVWDRRPVSVLVEAADTTPLVGMELLYGFELKINVQRRGQVTIKPLRRRHAR